MWTFCLTTDIFLSNITDMDNWLMADLHKYAVKLMLVILLLKVS